MSATPRTCEVRGVVLSQALSQARSQVRSREPSRVPPQALPQVSPKSGSVSDPSSASGNPGLCATSHRWPSGSANAPE